MILGATKDPTFGPVIMVGLGGVATEIYRRPCHRTAAAQRTPGAQYGGIAALLADAAGLPGQAPVDVDQLIEVMIRFSCLVADYPEIREFDINPLAGIARWRHCARCRGACSTEARPSGAAGTL